MMRDELIYLSAADVARVLPTPSELLDVLAAMFRHKAQSAVEMPPKLGIHPEDNSFIHAMPASIPPMSAVGIKWVSAYPGNASLELPQVSGLIILNDLPSGIARAVLDGSVITTARTAAASVLAARFLARPDSDTLGILGCGVQGRSHLEAFAGEFSLRRAIAFDASPDISQRFALEMSNLSGIDVVVASSAREAVEASDMVVTAGPITNPPHATIRAGWLRPGGFAVSIDYGSYWHQDALDEMDVLCTDDVAQYASHQRSGYLKGLPEIDLDLAELVSGGCHGRTNLAQRTFACNLGIALEDVVVAKEVVDRARDAGIGTVLRR